MTCVTVTRRSLSLSTSCLMSSLSLLFSPLFFSSFLSSPLLFITGMRDLMNRLIETISKEAGYDVRDSYTPFTRTMAELDHAVDTLLAAAAPNTQINPEIRDILRGHFSFFHSRKIFRSGAVFYDFRIAGVFPQLQSNVYADVERNYQPRDTSSVVDGSDLPMMIPERHFVRVLKSGCLEDVMMCVEDGTIWAYPELQYMARSLPSLFETVCDKLDSKEWFAERDSVGPADFFDDED